MERFNFTKNQKITLYTVPIAFTLSFLIGILSGNPVSVVVVRAIISSLLFSALLYGGLCLIRRYIPPLAGNIAGENTDVQTGQPFAEGSSEVQVLHPSQDSNASPEADYRISSTSGEQDVLEGRAVQSEDVSANGEVAGTDGRTAFSESKPAGSRLSDVSGENELEEISLDSSVDESNEELPSLDRLFDEHEQEAIPDIRPSSSVRKEKKSVVGDSIKVGDTRFPYEPEALAKAVKKVMKQDD
jgi:hypothetical protein